MPVEASLSPAVLLYDDRCAVCCWIVFALLRGRGRYVVPIGFSNSDAPQWLANSPSARQSWHLIREHDVVSRGRVLAPLLRLAGRRYLARSVELMPSTLIDSAYRTISTRRATLAYLVPKRSRDGACAQLRTLAR